MKRIGLIESVNDNVVRFMGYGEYLGEAQVDPSEFGFVDMEILAPKFKLDDGREFMGTDYWWCEEYAMVEQLKNYALRGYIIEKA